MSQVFNFYGESDAEIIRINLVLKHEEEKRYAMRLIIDEINEYITEIERKDCAMGPLWRKIYSILIDNLKSQLNVYIIRVIFEYYGLAPLMIDYADHFNMGSLWFMIGDGSRGYARKRKYVKKYWDNKHKAFTICTNCHRRCKHSNLIIATNNQSTHRHHLIKFINSDDYYLCKLRIFCVDCWPWPFDYSLKYGTGKLQNIKYDEPKMIKYDSESGNIIPLNDSAKLAFLCVDHTWCFNPRAKFFKIHVLDEYIDIAIY